MSGSVLLPFRLDGRHLFGTDLMDFPIVDLMDQEGCRQKLFDLLHPDGHACPRCGACDGLNIHRRHPDTPVIDYRCKECRRVFNMDTNTPWPGTHLSPAQILLILRGIAQGVPTAQLAREVGISRQHLLRLRHAIQARAAAAADRTPLPDDSTEADEMYQNAGEKRHSAHRPRRSATAAWQPGQGPRDLGDRPSAGARSDRPTERPAVAEGRSSKRIGRVGRRHGVTRHRAGSDGVHRRLERVQPAGTP
jgi:transposase-like protein